MTAEALSPTLSEHDLQLIDGREHGEDDPAIADWTWDPDYRGPSLSQDSLAEQAG